MASLTTLHERLAAVPEPTLTRSAAVERAIADTVALLDPAIAAPSIALDPYWPKWSSPWWHMLLLHELGESARIPPATVAAMVAGLEAMPLHIFPIHPGEAPPGTDLARDIACHCALGCMYQVLSACGVDVDRALPWVEAWFVRYQMADGGLNCDEQAYLATDECPSSMVGTIAPFEAMLVRATQRDFLARGARFLVERTLSQGSPTVQNAGERESALRWGELCFPRFYYYDVLRGLAALVRWAEATDQPLPLAAIAGVVETLLAQAPDGVVRVGRQAHAGMTTRVPTPDHSPMRREPVSTFPLLDAVGVIGEPSEALTRQWTAARHGLLRLIAAGRIG